MYQQEYRHGGISRGNVLALISAGVRTLTRYKASIAAWAIVAMVAIAAVTMQNYAQVLAPAGTSAAIAPHVGSGSGIAAPSPAAASPTPAATRAPVQTQAPAAVAPPAPAPAPAPAAAPAPPAPVAAPAPAAAPDTNAYTVVSGDTVGSIAARFGVDVNGMLAANGLSAYSVIVPGQVLKLTGPPVAAAPAPPPAPAPAPVAPVPVAPVPAPAPAPAVRTIYVAGSGGQAAVDSCIGPIHFTPTDAYSLFITEHDFCGGWARFSGIGVGETVSIPGYGTYTVTARGQVPQGGTTNNVAAVFGGFPRAILQTCIPGTNQMLVIALN
ncbi:LysM peptidoglycan-binding domain-containing protein [Arthrobacter sp. B2a2-09]|uniref:LysM peptidoglycan-binding domain-containing protein n=1 Tax=Arthrobacter sp. B2a2-09 TaxID=2952822 RepID=UPI0022CDA807|nr:LysM domain-containing protein [Arthrobacter sp. B2a2-09]MCZ9884169.1 LysM domain-containing protein [Arthrobacter sp. B2a2-09]